MITMTKFLYGKGHRALPRLALLASVAGAGIACNSDNLVRVQDITTLRPEDLANAGSIPALVNGSFRQFVGGYSGFGDDSFLSASAVISDETYYGDTFPTREAADKRNLQPTNLGNISDASFVRLQQARLNARRAYGVIDQYTTAATAVTDSTNRAQLRAIEGYVYVALSEGFCSDVPFSKIADTGPIDPNAIEGGVGLTTSQMNDTAVTRFNQAIANRPAATARFYRLAAIGKGRALLNLGRFAEASAAVASVPTGFVFLMQHSINTAAENNPMAALQQNGRYGVSNLEGGLTDAGDAIRADTASGTSAPSAEGIPFRGLLDPRVLWEKKPSNGACFSTSFRCWVNDNYPTLESAVPLATGVEARLIEAEAAMQAGDGVTFITKLNDLRANSSVLLNGMYPARVVTDPFKSAGSEKTLDPLVDPVTPDARRALLFRERALWLYNTGHRQGDLRRLARAPYSLPTNTVFPSGPHFRGGSYGNDVAYPVPFAEANNINFNPALCDTTKP